VLSALLVIMAVSAAWCQQAALVSIGFLTCSLTETSEADQGNVAGPLRQTREMLCVFKADKGGAEETYTGTFQSISDERMRAGSVMIWDVRAAPAMAGVPGLLQQLYVLDAAAAPGRASPLTGDDTNRFVMLETIADDRQLGEEEKKPPGTGTIGLLITLRLKTTPI
jgi:hypothetical protein